MAISTVSLIFVIFARVCYAKTQEKVTDPVAEIELSVYDTHTSKHGEYTVTKAVTLTGHFSPAGTLGKAQGDLLQRHPSSVCDALYDSDLPFSHGSIIVVKLEPHHDQCTLTVYQKAERIIQRGAAAVILDITHDLPAREGLREAGKLQPLNQPVILVHGVNAKELMEVIHREQNALARIRVGYNHTREATPSPRNEFLDMGIFIAFFILIAIICLLLVIKLRWRQRRKQDSQTRQTLHALSKMRTRKYKRGDHRRYRDPEVAITPSVTSDSSVCAICLDEFRDGEEIRVVPCEHEFHRQCVDPWLVTNKTCPLCMFDILEPDGKVTTPSVLGSPIEQYTELRVNLPATSGEEMFPGGRVDGSYEEPALQRHRHSLNSGGWAHPPPSRHDRRPLTYSGAYVQDLAQCSVPMRNTGVQECWAPNYSQWQPQPQPCDYVCSRCQRKVPKNPRKMNPGKTNAGKTNTVETNRRAHILGPELTSFESHYVSNMANQYMPIPGLNCPNGRPLSPTARHSHTYPCTPVPHPYQTSTPPPGPPRDLPRDPDRDSSSDSSLSLSAFHADYECSDSSSSPENENFDSNRSVFGSSTTCRSDPVAVDPELYARPGTVDQDWAETKPVTLTPSCVHRQETSQDPKLARLSSDSDRIKRSGSDANASSGSNFSTQAHASSRGSPHPYRPSCSSGTFIQAFVHSAKQKSHSFPRTSGSHLLTGASPKKRHHDQGGQLHPRPKDSQRVREIKSRPSPKRPNHSKHAHCQCCSGNANGSVWETKGHHNSRSKVRESGALSPGERRDGETVGKRRLRDERTGKLMRQQPENSKVQLRSKGQHRTRKSRAHLSLPIQSIATIDLDDGHVTTLPAAAAVPSRRKCREEIV